MDGLPPEVAAPPVFHGGGLDAARRRFPDAPLPWVDLSTGINPVSYPVGPIPVEAWRRLPDTVALARLEGAAARTYGAPDATCVVATPGTQAIIQWLPRLIPAQRVGVLDFGYQEHPAAWRAAGADVSTLTSLDGLADVDVAVVVNPNNPDGRLVPPGVLVDLARRGATLIVDEAFMDVMDPDFSLVPLSPGENIIVLRSFGKMYGLAGLRLGFAVGGPAFAAKLRGALGPWAVSGPAIAVATEALGDRAWGAGARARLSADAARLDRLLAKAGFEILGGTPLFRLAAHSRASRWFERFGGAGLLVRPFPARPTWLRFGLPGDDEAWARLDATCEAGPGMP